MIHQRHRAPNASSKRSYSQPERACTHEGDYSGQCPITLPALPAMDAPTVSLDCSRFELIGQSIHFAPSVLYSPDSASALVSPDLRVVFQRKSGSFRSQVDNLQAMISATIGSEHFLRENRE